MNEIWFRLHLSISWNLFLEKFPSISSLLRPIMMYVADFFVGFDETSVISSVIWGLQPFGNGLSFVENLVSHSILKFDLIFFFKKGYAFHYINNSLSNKLALSSFLQFFVIFQLISFFSKKFDEINFLRPGNNFSPSSLILWCFVCLKDWIVFSANAAFVKE